MKMNIRTWKNSGLIQFCELRLLGTPTQPTQLAALIDRACAVAKAEPNVWIYGGCREAAILHCRAVIDRGSGPTEAEEAAWDALSVRPHDPRAFCDHAVSNLLAAARIAASLTRPGFSGSYGVTPEILVMLLEWMLGNLLDVRLNTPATAFSEYRAEAKAIFGAWVEII